MQGNYSIFEYYSVSSRIHRLSFVFKIISLIIFIISLIFADNYIDLAVVNLYLLVIILWSNISMKFYLSNLRVFKFVLLIAFGLISLCSLNLLVGLIWTIKLFDLLIYVIIITITTSLNDMVSGFYHMFKPIRRFVDINALALNCALSIKFFGICYGEYNRIKTSQKIRGVRFNDMKFFDRIEYVFVEIKPVLRKSKDKLDILRKNMFIRDYGVSNYISNFRLNKWRKIDTMLLVINVMILIITFVY